MRHAVMTSILRSLESQLHDAMAELEKHGAIDASPSNLEQYDEGAATAEAVMLAAKHVQLLAEAIAARRAMYRGDFIAEMAEKAARSDDLYAVKNADFL